MYMSRTHIGFTVVREGKLKSTFVGMCIWAEEEKERGRERERDGEREGQRNWERWRIRWTHIRTQIHVTNPRTHIEFILVMGALTEADPCWNWYRERERERQRERERAREKAANQLMYMSRTHVYVTNSCICHELTCMSRTPIYVIDTSKKAMWRLIPVENRYIYGKLA